MAESEVAELGRKKKQVTVATARAQLVYAKNEVERMQVLEKTNRGWVAVWWKQLGVQVVCCQRESWGVYLSWLSQ